MKIAIVASPYYPVPPAKYGGTERVIFYLIKGLLESGHEPILIGTGDSKVDCEIVPIVDKAIPFPKKDSDGFRSAEARAIKQTEAVLQKVAGRVDIIHSMGVDLKAFQAYPNVTTIHGHIGFEELDYYRARQDMPFVSISKNQQAAYPSLNYVGLAYNGEDPAEFPAVTEPDDYLCFISRFDVDKAPHLAIQLALSLGVKIKMAGKIDLGGSDYFKEEIKPYLDHPLVEFLGEVGFKDKVELLSKAKCNLHPLLGRREPFGLTVIEAAYCGTPTMAMARGSMTELIDDRKTGLLVEDFVEGHHRFGEIAKIDRAYVAKHSRQQFNYQKMTADYLAAYKKVLGRYGLKKSRGQKKSESLIAKVSK